MFYIDNYPGLPCHTECSNPAAGTCTSALIYAGRHNKCDFACVQAQSLSFYVNEVDARIPGISLSFKH